MIYFINFTVTNNNFKYVFNRRAQIRSFIHMRKDQITMKFTKSHDDDPAEWASVSHFILYTCIFEWKK